MPKAGSGTGVAPFRRKGHYFANVDELAQFQQGELVAIIAAMAVVATLIATLAYTSVLTPPSQRSDCQSLCFESTTTLVWLNLYTKLAQEVKAASGDVLTLPEVVDFQNSINVPVRYGLGPVISIWAIFNGLALHVALLTILVASFGVLMAQANVSAESAMGSQAPTQATKVLAKVVYTLAWLLIASIFAALVAFTFAQFITFHISGNKNVAAWISLVGAIMLMPLFYVCVLIIRGESD